MRIFEDGSFENALWGLVFTFGEFAFFTLFNLKTIQIVRKGKRKFWKICTVSMVRLFVFFMFFDGPCEFGPLIFEQNDLFRFVLISKIFCTNCLIILFHDYVFIHCAYAWKFTSHYWKSNNGPSVEKGLTENITQRKRYNVSFNDFIKSYYLTIVRFRIRGSS